ncbi:MAG: 16S rRNA (cytosine(1402)-N(4))-methyltransferase [Parcubacteria group bacterium CG11_big_fil_rev_8_21_14_0_20_39_22]|nr:MAG: 16S rRNA (cytosine(1402)-N(4))-methyltransferase [Parcubacteria group bacterium CG11_big_fil_rev_8_21_14_0_20_39_22]
MIPTESTNNEVSHIPVLLNEVCQNIDPQKGDVILDGTIGDGGHSKELCELGGGKISIIAFDADKNAIETAKKNLSRSKCKMLFVNRNFRELKEVLKELKIDKVNAVLLDLGWSSRQLSSSGRGFSFQKDEPLLMTLSSKLDENTLTAKDIVNEWDEKNIETIIRNYGEERFSGRIAKAIVKHREEKEIKTTFELKSIIESAVPAFYRRGKINPSTKTFQALRITVNDEIESLKATLLAGISILAPGGKMAIISFHSIEDRVVKREMQGWVKAGLGSLASKKPIVPSEVEIKNNPRSRSAKLRVFIKN